MTTLTAMQGYIRNTKLSSREKEEKIPAIIYGKSIKTNIMLYVLRKDFMDFFINVGKKDCYATVLTLHLEGKTYKIIVRDIQWKKDSSVPYPIHLDFFEIEHLQKLSTKMYINFINEDKCIGVKNGGKLQITMKECRVTANPHTMPAVLKVDLISLAIGKKITVEELEQQYAYCNLHIHQRYKIAAVVGKK